MRSMKSIFVAMALSGIVLLGGLQLTPAVYAADQVELKMTIGFPESDSFSVGMSKWIALVSEKTGGRVKITPFFGGSLVPLPETLDAVREGSADLGALVASFTTGKVPGLAAFEALGSCPGDHAKYVEMLSKTEPVVGEMFAEQGLVYMFMQPAFGIDLAARDKNLVAIDELKGLKIRHSGRWGQAQFQTIGVNTVVIPPGDVYQALQTGVVDAAFGTNSLTFQLKWYEVASFITHLDMIGNANFIIMNKNAWKRISEEDQKTILALSREFGGTSVTALEQSQLDALKKLEEQGATVRTWNDQEKAAFLKATSQVWEDMKKHAGPFGVRLIDIMEEYRR